MNREKPSEVRRCPWLPQWRSLLWGGAIAAMVVLAFHEGMRYPLLSDWDDVTFIVQNPHIDFTWSNLLFYLRHPFQDLFSPLPMWSLMVDRALWGDCALGYHLHNLILHILTAWILLALLRKLGVRLALAGMGTLLWALNPQKVESVIWVSERKDLLCGLFAFLAVWLFLERRWGWCSACTVLAIFAKPAALALPGIYVVYAWGRGESWRRREVLVPCACGLLAVLWSMVVTSETNPGTVERALLVPLHNLCWYPLTALVPFETNPFYPETITVDAHFLAVVAGGLVLLVGGVGVARWLKCSWRGILAVLAVLGGTMLPVLGLLHYTNFRYCDRYNYLVSATVIAALALLMERVLLRWTSPRLQRAMLGTMALVAVLYASCTYLYVPYWENCVRLAYYGLQRPGQPNLKAYELGIMAGFRLGADEFLEYLKRELPQRPPATPYDVESSVQTLLLFMDAHQQCLAGEYTAADDSYRRLVETMSQGQSATGAVQVALPPPLVAWLYEDLARIAEQQGDHQKAEFYRKSQMSK